MANQRKPVVTPEHPLADEEGWHPERAALRRLADAALVKGDGIGLVEGAREGLGIQADRLGDLPECRIVDRAQRLGGDTGERERSPS